MGVIGFDVNNKAESACRAGNLTRKMGCNILNAKVNAKGKPANFAVFSEGEEVKVA